MKKLILLFVVGMFFISFASALSSYYDPNSDSSTNWDDGTGITFAEIDEGTRQPSVPGTGDTVAESTQGAAGISEFGFPTVTETPDNMTLWVYTNTGASCNYDFFLQQAGATRCTTTVSSGTADSWQSCTWASPSGSFTAMTAELGTVTKGGGAHTTCTVYEAYIEVGYSDNDAPNITNISAVPTLIKGGNTITIYGNSTDHGVNDTDGDSLNFYCDTSTTPTAANTDCTGGTTSDSTDPYDMSCTFTTPTNSSNHTIFCRVYDSITYSTAVNLTYETDATPPTTSVTSVEGDTSPSYFDAVDNSATEINITGEASMVCRWSASDLSYSSMSNACTISGSTGSCSVTDALTQGAITRYVACQDSLGNGQNSTQNLDVSFFLDYTAPTTSDNSVSAIQTPNYVVTLTEADNVDSDPTTLYCTDTVGSCVPSLSIDDGGTVTFTSSNRGVNYLRYNSTDDAGNQQATTNKTININQLPVFTSTSDDATTISGGATVNVSSVSSDADSSQDMTLWVCNSTAVTSSGCSSGHYCNATSSANMSCTFTAESDSATHTWYSFVYDELGEISVSNYSGSYTTDATAPTITVTSPTNASTITQSSVTFTITLDEALSWAAYSLNGGANVSMSNTSLLEWTHANLSIADGTYNLTLYANDSYNNLATASGYLFIIDTTPADTTPPTITIRSPVNNTYYTVAAVLLNITTDEDLEWAGYTNNSGLLTDLGNVSTTSWNATVTFSEGQHNITFFANDTSSNQANRSVVIYVDLTNPAIDSFSCIPNPVNDSIDVVCNASVSDDIGLDYVIIGHNATGSFQNSSQISVSGTAGNASYTIASGNSTPGVFTTEVYAYDLSGRLNGTTTYNVNVSDDTFPLIYNITYLPNTTDTLDPGVRVDVNTTITEDHNISSVVLMYQNISSGVWTSITMANNSAKVDGGSSNVIYNASFTPQNGTWVFQINATDNAGNQNVSENITIVVTNDTSFFNSTSISDVVSFTFAQRSGNNTLGTLFLNNTGDGNLDFSLNVTSSIRDRFDINYTSDPNVTYTVGSGNNINLTIFVNTTGLSAALYDYNLSVNSLAGSATFVKQLNIQTAVGPFLVVTIGTFSSSVARSQTAVEFTATVENSGTQDASDVYLNWTLPSEFTLATGSLSRSLGTLGIGISGSNTITIDVNSNAAASSVNITATGTATGLNSTNVSKSVTITDPVEEAADTSRGGGGGGGGGGGSGSSGGSLESRAFSEAIEVVRGPDGGVTFDISIVPSYIGTTLENLVLELTGYEEQYISISPALINQISYGETDFFTITLSAPSYVEYEEHSLTATILGNLVRSDGTTSKYIETHEITLIIQEIALSPALDLLEEARQAIELMKERGYYITDVESLLEQAKNRLDERKNKEAYDLAQEILEIKEQASFVDDLIRRIISAEQDPRKSYLLVGNLLRTQYEEGIDSETPLASLLTGDVVFSNNAIKELLELSVAAFERGDYDLAEERAKEAQGLLVLERKGNLGLFLYLYWHFILLGMLAFSVLGLLSYKGYKKASITRKIWHFNKEEFNIWKNFGNFQ